MARRGHFGKGGAQFRRAFPYVYTSFDSHNADGAGRSRLISLRMARGKPAERPGPVASSMGLLQSCSWRLSASISSAKALSLPASASILRTACNTVVWSRPPNRRPISGSERSVKTFARYIAT